MNKTIKYKDSSRQFFPVALVTVGDCIRLVGFNKD